MRLMKTIPLLSLVLVGLTVGCSKEEAAKPKAEAAAPADSQVTLVNSVCPIAGKEASEDVIVVWKGKTVGFCCADCISAWEELSDEEKAAKLAAADSQPAKEHEHDAS